MIVKRGEVYFADLSPVVGSEQGGIRPVLIVQNNLGNKFSSTVIALAISKHIEKRLPIHTKVNAHSIGLPYDSVVMAEQIRTIDKKRLRGFVGVLTDRDMERVDRSLIVSFALSRATT